MSKSPRIQARNFSCVTYLSPEQFHEVLSRKDSQVKHYAYILHDKDVNDDGTPKEPHFHLLVCLHHNVNESTFRNWWKGFFDPEGKPINTLVEITRSVPVTYRYLYHADDPDKFQYPETDIVATDPSWFNDEVMSDSDEVWGWVELVLNGTPLREVARIGGRDFIYHYNAVRVLVNDIRDEEERALGKKVDAFYRGEDIDVDL